MAKQHRPSESLRAVAGVALVGLGLHSLFGNLDRAATQSRHLLGVTAGDGLGLLSSVVMASSQAGQAYAVDHQGFVLSLLRMLVSFWPLLLVIVGTIFLRDTVTEKVKGLPTPAKYFQNRDSECRFCCPSFDA